MRGKRGYVEGASHAEGVDRSSPPLPSGRWTLDKIRSMPEDAMLDRCTQMIAPSVKSLRCHGLLRKPVDVAMDFHHIRRYDRDPDRFPPQGRAIWPRLSGLASCGPLFH